MMDYESYISGLSLPKCGFKFWYATSEWVLDHYDPYILEEVIPGFRTHSVTGRDNLSSDLREIDYSRQDGSGYRSKRHVSRDLTIEYGLTSNSVEHHRKQLNKLRSMLHKRTWQGSSVDASYGNAEQLYIVFNDEPDVFYKGTVSEITEEKFVQNFSSTGKITIHCADPFKYSLNLYFVQPTIVDGNTIFSLQYNGTQPSSPRFDIEFHGDTGYAAFIDDTGKVIQIGDPEITGNATKQIYDEQTKGEKEEIFNNRFSSSSNWRNIDSAWSLNAYASDPWNVPIHAMGDFVTYGDGLYITDPSTSDEWHGPSLKRTFSPVNDFLFESGLYLAKSKPDQKATVCLDFTIFGDYGIATAERPLIRVSLWGVYVSNHDAKLAIELAEKRVKIINYQNTRDSKNKYSWKNVDSESISQHYVPLYIERYKNKISITVYDKTYSFNNGIPEGSRATGVGIHMYVLDDKYILRTNSDHKYVYGAGIRHARFYSLPVQWKDVSNKFVRDDWVTIDCKTGSIDMNGGERPGLGALGNDFETFKLQPGLNEIKFAWSEWCRAAPSPQLRYREVFL